MSFPSIRIEGGLIGPELLDQVIAADVSGQKPAFDGDAVFQTAAAVSGPTEKEILMLSRRDDYIETQLELLAATPKQVRFYLNKLHRTDRLGDEIRTKDIVAINRAIKKASDLGSTVQVLVGAIEDRLPGAIQLANTANIEIRFDPAIVLGDANFLCTDSNLVVGMRQRASNARDYQSSREWYHIVNGTLLSAMNNMFTEQWDAPSTLTLDPMLRRFIPSAVSTSTTNKVAQYLGLTPETVNA